MVPITPGFDILIRHGPTDDNRGKTGQT